MEFGAILIIHPFSHFPKYHRNNAYGIEILEMRGRERRTELLNERSLNIGSPCPLVENARLVSRAWGQELLAVHWTMDISSRRESLFSVAFRSIDSLEVYLWRVRRYCVDGIAHACSQFINFLEETSGLACRQGASVPKIGNPSHFSRIW